jgi:hypothetical protein
MIDPTEKEDQERLFTALTGNDKRKEYEDKTYWPIKLVKWSAYLIRSLFEIKFVFVLRKYLIISGIIFFILVNSSLGVTVAITSGNAVRGPWIGCGLNWLSYDYSSSTPSSSDWTNTYVPRLSWMRLGVVRVLMTVQYMLNSDKTYNFSTPEMVQLYRVLDYCQANNIAVILTEWGNGWTNPSGWVFGDTNYTNAIGAYMQHLINTKKYTCIKYFVLGNEPNYDSTNYSSISQWASVITTTKNKFSSLGLSGFTVIGPDTSDADSWAITASTSYSSLLGGYDVHKYEYTGDLLGDGLETYFKNSIWGPISSKDTNNSGKLYVIGEAGIADGMSQSSNTNIGTYDYGVWMADYGVQAARAGTGAIAAWMLDDDGISGFSWALWMTKSAGYGLRPWFYTWSLLSRYIPSGSTIYAPTNPSSTVRVLGAQTSVGTWTFIAVNRGSQSVSLTFTAPGNSQQNFKYYLYSNSSRQIDDSGFPIPISTVQAIPSSGITQSVPANAVSVFTSIDHRLSPPVLRLITE